MAPNSDKPAFEFSWRTRRADWTYLKNNPDHIHNVVIIGGGIVGAGVLREFALRGIADCFLFEKNDFASATSGASSKLIHAGIRYLEQSWQRLKRGRWVEAWQNFIYVAQASSERRSLGELAPHLIKPKPIYFLVAEGDRRSVGSVFLGIWFYYLIQLIQGQIFPPPKVIFRKEAMKWMAPHLNHQKIKAIFSFWDSETDDARLVIENLQNAVQNGGHALNYIELVEFEKKEKETRLTIRDRETGETLVVKAKVVVNATGPFLDEVNSRRRGEKRALTSYVDRVAGAHINVFPAISDESYYITAGDNRLVFVLKRNEDGLVYSRIGTTERPLSPSYSSDSPKATQEEIQYLKELVKDYFPHAELNDESIVSTDAGIRPLLSQEGHSPFQKSREHRIVDEGGLYHVIGVKLTDYRRVSRELFNLISWKTFNIQPSSNDSRADYSLLRTSNSSHLYKENDLEEIVNQTMVIHWDDYVFRRRGLLPRLVLQKDANKINSELDHVARWLEWDSKRIEAERKRVASF